MASGQLKRLSFMVDASLFDAIELARGDVPRERWLRRAVERALSPYLSEPVMVVDEVATDLVARMSPQVRSHSANCKCPVCS